jgi:hypothetical protein
VTRAQLAILPPTDGRKAERRVVNLAARLREPGARLVDVELANLSVTGFMTRGDTRLEVGDPIWLKVPGFSPEPARVVWVEGDQAGFEFASPLHAATVEMLAAAGRKPAGPQKRLFGPRGVG